MWKSQNGLCLTDTFPRVVDYFFLRSISGGRDVPINLLVSSSAIKAMLADVLVNNLEISSWDERDSCLLWVLSSAFAKVSFNFAEKGEEKRRMEGNLPSVILKLKTSSFHLSGRTILLMLLYYLL